ncbi:hypothetical protein JCM31826_21370 [Thermaurantimonas aggregans]|uniref:T9SS C-terminal target domain-containing protein n=1 Tax=Thermaurantimonas aggregans TaxID=2173829 RepID=A0A401XNS9_9FLAO|nr:hypothetical protein [Thermaurantimonas aggregans]MCX8149481.1 hypothetical protein [Thermaurantimonas aggregans]GCD78655.1 hypothetical protein JCM31826_21370 [Thermaurantimonas aggregans]
MPVLQFKNVLIQIFLTFTALTGLSQRVELEPVCKLPKALNENSGMVAWGDTLLWLINDSGNDPILYAINTRCVIVKKIWVKGAENIDWEELAEDQEGNIFIGDIGNNSNKRETLAIYKISKRDLIQFPDSVQPIETICFFYGNQPHFTPEKSKRYFDAEALFYYNNSLILVTKNRTDPFDGKAYVYRIPIEEGNHRLFPDDSLFTGLGLMELHWIAGADRLSEDKILLLGYDKLFLTTIKEFKKIKSIDLGMWKQFESIALGEKFLYISNEKNKKNKPFLYRIPIKDLEKLFDKI